MLTALRADASQWRRVRAESFDRRTVARATALREAGDWRGACAATRIDVAVDLDDVRHRYGAGTADAIEGDLRHFAPDLLWWHLPRHVGGLRTLQPRLDVVLPPPTDRDAGPLLRIRLPKSPRGPQRLRLDVVTREELRQRRWYVTPCHTWDVRRAGELRTAWGGSATRMPLFRPDGTPLPEPERGRGEDPAAHTERVYAMLYAGEYGRAWQACGIKVVYTAPESLYRNGVGPGCPVDLIRQVRDAGRAFRTPRVSTVVGAHVAFELTEEATVARVSAPDVYREVPVRVPVDAVPVDLVLLADGSLRPGDLHPLVRAALFPGTDASPDPPPPPPARASLTRVRCGGQWHRAGVIAGAFSLPEHSAAERERERILRAVGGTSGGCFAAEQGWTEGGVRLPRALERRRREIRTRLLAGDTDFLLDGLADGSIDPRMRDGAGWTLTHMVMWVDWRRALPALLDAGAPLDAGDRIGRTPLYVAVMNGADPDLMRRLLALGADHRAGTVHGSYPSYVAHQRSDWQDLSFFPDPTSH
ncbi:hypothetical protein Val02_88340 [Virgisporangium aliadipatigenens]|uniref:Ankyrin repeat domain-containing protein n=1 Tax=Virgisporangium aliadipatigenens TaxID=741659 RepID=A0A8J3YWN2_9ACTN|nr:hypothetical protein [Virgisporangium aliadipatigenens]GIJ51948.1 hypothetical protein Val02_88340 [Virgisporangium aliadipatigenens]